MIFHLPITRRPLAILVLTGATVFGSACAPRITTDQEVQMGEDLAAEINRELPIVDVPPIHGYINDLGSTIARTADPRDIPYSFYVVNTAEVNAFAVPGGHVYLFRGLIERTENLSELAGVVAHEVAHVVERHGIEQWRRAQQAQMGLALASILLGGIPDPAAVAIELGAAGVFAGYSRDAEREADEEAVDYLVEVGIHPEGLVTFFEKLLEERRREPGALEQFFATHPTTEERMENTRGHIAAIPADQLAGLQQDSDAFQQFRQQVIQLPPPPQ